MKMLLLVMALAVPSFSTPVFAQAANDIASKLQEGHDYSQGRRTMRRQARAARRHARMSHTMTAPVMTQ